MWRVDRRWASWLYAWLGWLVLGSGFIFLGINGAVEWGVLKVAEEATTQFW